VSDLFSGWASFPELFSLVELDLRNCSIQHLTAGTFTNVPNLKKLYLSHNNFIQIPSNIFEHLRLLVHLDLAYQNIVSSSMNSFNSDPYAVISEGLNLPENVFRYLPNLAFLDLSHSRIIPSSVKAFAMLGPKLQQLSPGKFNSFGSFLK
jgi:Leucine-rich repeat (LRR) protein